jgi:hypothetical protein
MSKTVSLYDPHLISSHHLQLLPSYDYYQRQKHYSHLYDEKNCAFNLGNLFANEFFAVSTRNRIAFSLVGKFFREMFHTLHGNTSYRRLQARENSHLLAALWRCIRAEARFVDYYKTPRENIERGFEDTVNFVVAATGFELRQTYICMVDLSLEEEDKLPLNDIGKSEKSKEKTVSAIPFMHYIAKHSDSKDLELAKRERRIAFSKFLFKARDIQQALRVVDEDGSTLADTALINGNYDVYALLKEEHKKLNMNPPALNWFLKVKNFQEAKEQEKQLFMANLMQDPELLDACALLPECKELLNIRLAENGLTLLEWAVITKNYRMTASLFNADPSRIRQIFAMAGVDSIKILYRESLKYTRTDDEDLRVLLQCYATGRPDLIEDMDKQISYFFELINSGKINKAGLAIICESNKNIAKEILKYIQSLPLEIGHSILQQSLDPASVSLVGPLLLESKFAKSIKIFHVPKVGDDKIQEAITQSRQGELIPLEVSVMDIKMLESPVYPVYPDLWSAIISGEVKHLKTRNLGSDLENELKFAIILSPSPKKLKHAKLSQIVEKSLEAINKNRVMEDLLTEISTGRVNIQFLLALPDITVIRRKIIDYIVTLKDIEKSYGILCSALFRNHPLYQLLAADKSIYISLVKAKESLEKEFFQNAKEIFIKFFKSSHYFPTDIKGVKPDEISDTSLITHSLKYLEKYNQEGQALPLLQLASYIFAAQQQSTPYINLSQLQQLRLITLDEPELKYQNSESRLVSLFREQRDQCLKDLKDCESMVNINLLLGRILVCNKALEILFDPEATVRWDLLKFWKDRFPKDVFDIDLDRYVSQLVSFRQRDLTKIDDPEVPTELSIYDHRLITEYNSMPCAELPEGSAEYREIKIYQKYYDEVKCVFHSGNIFLSVFQEIVSRNNNSFSLSDSSVPRTLPEFLRYLFYIPSGKKNQDSFRAATTIENSHVLAALWQCILFYSKNFLMPQDWVKQSMGDAAYIPRFLISDTYICEDKIFLQDEDKLPCSDIKKSPSSKQKKVNVVPFIHHIAKHTRPDDLERAKVERRQGFMSIMFYAYDLRKALLLCTGSGATLADTALISGNDDVYAILRSKHSSLGMPEPKLNLIFTQRNFRSDWENPWFWARIHVDILEKCLKNPACIPLLKIRFFENGLTPLELAVLTKNYAMVVNIFNIDPADIRKVFTMAGLACIQALYKESLKLLRTDDEDLRVLLQCYATQRPDLMDDMDKQISYVFELMINGKINKAGLAIILENNKTIAEKIEKYIKSLPPEICNFFMSKSLISSSGDDLLASLWADSKSIPKIKLFQQEVIAENDIKDSINQSRQSELPPPELTVMDIKQMRQSIYPTYRDLWASIISGEIQRIQHALKIQTLAPGSEHELKYAIILSQHSKKFKNLLKQSSQDSGFLKEIRLIMEESTEEKNHKTIMEDLLRIISQGKINIQFLLDLPSISSIRLKILDYIVALKDIRKSYRFLCAALIRNHPLYQLLATDTSTYHALIAAKDALEKKFLQQAKGIFINFFKNSAYFPDTIADVEDKEDSGTSLITQTLKYLEVFNQEGQTLSLSALAGYIFLAQQLKPYIRLDQLQHLAQVPIAEQKLEYQESECKLVAALTEQREKYLEALKANIPLVETNSILGKILVCNKALAILSKKEATVGSDLLTVWKKSFPRDVFARSAHLERFVEQLIVFRARSSSDELAEENPVPIPVLPALNPEAEEQNDDLPLAYNPDAEQPPAVNPNYLAVQEEDSPEGQPAIQNIDPDCFFVQEQKEYNAPENKNISQDFSIGEVDSVAEMTTCLVNIPGIGEICMQLSVDEFQKLKAAKLKGETHFQATLAPMPREQSALEPGSSYSSRLFHQNSGKSGGEPGLQNSQSSLN